MGSEERERSESQESREWRDSREPQRPSSVVEFLDTLGVRWRVTERDSRRDPGTRGDRCLIFASNEAVRRVWIYPVGWRELSAAALAALSWQR